MVITDFYYSDTQSNVLREKHAHNTYQLIFVQEGEMTVKIAGKEVQCIAPALVFIGNCEPHTIVETSKNYLYKVCFTAAADANDVKLN